MTNKERNNAEAVKAFIEDPANRELLEGDTVLVRMTVRGTHRGMFFGNAPTGRSMEVALYRRYRVENGKIAEHRGWIDIATMMKQIKGE